MIVHTALLSTSAHLVTKEDKKQLSALYQKSNWAKSTQTQTLAQLVNSKNLEVIRTDNLVVIDFDDDKAFQRALTFNATLQPENQCNFIVKSTRHGGHFYYQLPTNTNDTTTSYQPQLPLGHTKQSILDILTTDKHNVIAPTLADKGKILLTPDRDAITDDYELTPYNEAINTLVSLIVAENVPSQVKALTLVSQDRKSDDAKDFIKSYLADIVTQGAFHKFYSIPDPIPDGMSNQVYLNLSTRLGSDETISESDYLRVMEKFNLYHQRKSVEELHQTITNRMVNNLNGLWRYDPNKVTGTFSTTHKTYKTQITSYFDIKTGEYLVHYLTNTGEERLEVYKNTTAYIDSMEKISTMPKQYLRNSTKDIAAVDIIHSYTAPAGYNADDNTYNTAIHNSNLVAFSGTKPLGYDQAQVDKLLGMLRYMWGESYDYLLSATKHRYTTFKWSPVVTFLQGTEGSGKDLTISLLSAGFSKPPQTLNYALMKDMHSNWQTEENAIFSEVGDWKPMERDDLLAQLKTISGSNGKVTFRGMQRTSEVVPTLIKIWVTGNHWVKLHSDPLTQRRIHIVYMPNPLDRELGGDYTTREISELMGEQSIQNFYYWLGNIYSNADFAPSHYYSAVSQQQTEAYQMYIEDTESISDKISTLLWSREWDDFSKILDIIGLTLNDLDYKFSRGNLVITVASLKSTLTKISGGDLVAKTINRITSEKEGNKRLLFSGKSVEKFITIFGAPEETPETNMDIEQL